MRVLVTGGTGFIGQHVVKRLRAEGHSVLVLDRHREWSGVTALGDVRDKAAVDAAVADSDAVIHLAAVLGTQETMAEPEIAAEVNLLGSLNVFKAVRRYALPAVYIAVGNHWMNNPYSITKTAAERFALMFNQEFGTKIAVVRGFNAYGPGQKPGPVRKIIPNFIIPALRGEEITVYGDGSQVMDMIYVEDVANILVRALGTEPALYEAGTGRATTVNEIAEMVISLVGKGSIKRVPMRPGEPVGATVLADPETLAPLKVQALTSLEDGLKQTVLYYERYVETGCLL